MFASADLPSIQTHMPNFTEVELGSVTVWFSYQTPIAFRVSGEKRIVRRNEWGVTTGKHLNWLDSGDKDSRVDAETFHRLWREATGQAAPIRS